MATESEGRRRFIAGARCPQCGAEDRIVTFEDAGKQVMACVACHYRQEEPSGGDVNRIIAVSVDPPSEPR